MYRRKLTTIKTQTIEQVVISVVNADPGVSDCADCGSGLLALAEAESEYGLSVAALRNLIESGRIHSSQTIDGHLLICRRSIESKNLNGELK